MFTRKQSTLTLQSDQDLASMHEAYLSLSGPDSSLDGSFKNFVDIIKPKGPLHRGAYIFRQGDVFDDLILVRVGCVKCSLIDENGDERITDFCLSGDVADINSVYTRVHGVSAIALSTVMLYQVPLDKALGCIRGLSMQLLRLMSQSLERSQTHSQTKSADQKVAGFLENFGRRLHKRGFSKTQHRLPMTRSDISMYLGLSPETVSRVLAHFQDMDVIRVFNHDIEIISADKLTKLYHKRA